DLPDPAAAVRPLDADARGQWHLSGLCLDQLADRARRADVDERDFASGPAAMAGCSGAGCLARHPAGVEVASSARTALRAGRGAADRGREAAVCGVADQLFLISTADGSNVTGTRMRDGIALPSFISGWKRHCLAASTVAASNTPSGCADSTRTC